MIPGSLPLFTVVVGEWANALLLPIAPTGLLAFFSSPPPRGFSPSTVIAPLPSPRHPAPRHVQVLCEVRVVRPPVFSPCRARWLSSARPARARSCASAVRRAHLVPLSPSLCRPNTHPNTVVVTGTFDNVRPCSWMDPRLRSREPLTDLERPCLSPSSLPLLVPSHRSGPATRTTCPRRRLASKASCVLPCSSRARAPRPCLLGVRADPRPLLSRAVSAIRSLFRSSLSTTLATSSSMVRSDGPWPFVDGLPMADRTPSLARPHEVVDGSEACLPLAILLRLEI